MRHLEKTIKVKRFRRYRWDKSKTFSTLFVHNCQESHLLADWRKSNSSNKQGLARWKKVNFRRSPGFWILFIVCPLHTLCGLTDNDVFFVLCLIRFPVLMVTRVPVLLASVLTLIPNPGAFLPSWIARITFVDAVPFWRCPNSDWMRSASVDLRTIHRPSLHLYDLLMNSY